jgi:hypothetical protein
MEKIVEQYQAQSSNIKGKHISFYWYFTGIVCASSLTNIRVRTLTLLCIKWF